MSAATDVSSVLNASGVDTFSRTKRLEYVFLVIALVWGVAQVFIVPPLQVPDEGDHWFRAWALTDGQLTADRQGMITLPGVFARTVDLYTRLVSDTEPLPISLEGQAGFTGYADLFNGTGPSGTVSVASRVANYGPVGFLPQALGHRRGAARGSPTTHRLLPGEIDEPPRGGRPAVLRNPHRAVRQAALPARGAAADDDARAGQRRL